MKKVKNFTDPTDKASAAACTRQIAEFEDNAEAEANAIRDAYQPNMEIGKMAANTSGLVIGAGQAAGFDTSTNNLTCLLRKPTPGDAGRFLLVWKLYAPNQLTLEAAAGTSINRTISYPVFNQGYELVFCDGVEYWTRT